MVQAPPRTILQVFESLPEGTLAEVINHHLLMEPAPDYYHQDTSAEISRLLGNHVAEQRLGKLLSAPLDVYLDEGNIYQPDIIFLSNQRLATILKAGKVKGVPDLVIEILSPSTEKYDRGDKKDVYENYGVQEYWLVNPRSKQAIGYQLQDGKYVEFFNKIGELSSITIGITIHF